jgi:hypothetical protein
LVYYEYIIIINNILKQFDFYFLLFSVVFSICLIIIILHVLIYLDQNNSFGIRAIGKSIGKVVINVKITQSPKELALKGKKASITLNVFEQLPHSPILMALNSNYPMNLYIGNFNQANLQYEVTNNDKTDDVYLSLSDPKIDGKNGKSVISLSRETTIPALIQISTLSEPTQTIFAQFEVKHVSGISLSPFSSPFNLHIGDTQQFEINVHDRLGSKFQSYDGLVVGM